MDSSAGMLKSALIDTPLYIYRIADSNRDRGSQHSVLQIPNFSRLRNNENYHHQDFVLDRNFTIRKSQEKITIAVDGVRAFDQENWCVTYNDEWDFTGNFYARETGEGTMEWQIPSATMEGVDNLCISFFPFSQTTPRPRCLAGRRVFRTVRKTGFRLAYADEDEKMLESIASMYRKTLLTDFEILVDEESFHVHKAIMAARSKYFHDYIRTNASQNGNASMRVDASYNAVKIVIDFVYTGQVFNALEQQPIWEILSLAWKYNLDGLMLLVEDILLNYFSELNLYRMKAAVRKYGLKKLSAAVNRALINRRTN